jgi:hypothetical protein
MARKLPSQQLASVQIAHPGPLVKSRVALAAANRFYFEQQHEKITPALLRITHFSRPASWTHEISPGY